MILGAVVGCGRAWGASAFLTLTRVTPRLGWLRAEPVLASLTGLIAVQYESSTIRNWRCTRNPALPKSSNSPLDLMVFALQVFAHSPCSSPKTV